MMLGFNSNYCPGWRALKFIVPLNALMTIWCIEASIEGLIPLKSQMKFQQEIVEHRIY
jgi:hypothetical protein